jgi:hypothetical protein
MSIDQTVVAGIDGAATAPPTVLVDTVAAAGQDSIAGTATLRGLMLYGAVLTFAGLYGYFIIAILSAAPHKPPAFDAATLSAAAALSGVLGSAFALRIGIVPTHVNAALKAHLAQTPANRGQKLGQVLHQTFSIEPGDQQSKSWPLTCGIWVYAIVGSAVAVTYIFNQNQTPGAVKALGLTFAGYVLALINSAYGLSKSPAG